MQFVSVIEGAFAWMYTKGIFRQVPLYIRGEAIFAKWGAGYVRLRANGATSNPNIRWNELDGGDLCSIQVRDMKDPRLTGYKPTAIAAE